MVHKYGIGTIYYSTVLAYSTKKYAKGDHPKTWAQFWDTKAFPARGPCATTRPTIWSSRCWPTTCRSTRSIPWTSNGRSNRWIGIKKNVNVWWTTGAQPAQLLSDGEVELATSWSGRIFAIQKQGAKAGLEWNQGKLQWDSG